LTLEDAKGVVKQFVSDYNDRRLHRAIGYITPSDMLAGKQKAIHEERDRKLEEAREDRAKIRAQQAAARYAKSTRPEDRAMLGSNLSAESMPKASAMGVEAESLPPGTCHLPLATMR
jgi:plasmid stability protein